MISMARGFGRDRAGCLEILEIAHVVKNACDSSVQGASRRR
jgi:hypothetical protein